MQHFVPLLACDNPAVVTAALQALLAFVRRSSNAQSRWPGEPLLNARLAALLQGWGGKAEVRGTGACTSQQMSVGILRLVFPTFVGAVQER